jgi:broad specificity phosphatase PhoE
MDELLFGRTIDVPLDANGERQAQMLAARLARETDLLIEASPRARTQQTAKTIAATTRAELLTSIDIDEIDFGSWSGRCFVALAEDPQWRKWNERRDIAHTPGGESISRVQSRIARHLHRLQAAFPNRTIAIVTHAEIIRSALLWVLQMPASAYDRLEISPASITALMWRNGGFKVLSVNERPDVNERPRA